MGWLGWAWDALFGVAVLDWLRVLHRLVCEDPADWPWYRGP